MAYLDNGGVSHLWKRIRNAISHGAPARNLLDNSDFSNPVNQRGKNSYSTVGYTIDRWNLDPAGDRGITLTDSGVKFGSTSSLVSFSQNLSEEARKRIAGKTVTAVATASDGSVGIVRETIPKTGLDVDSMQVPIGGSGISINIFGVTSWNSLSVRLLGDTSSGVTITHVALYEGSYTAETLPPYVPKGYAAELAECMRYYIEDTCVLVQKSTDATYSVGKIYRLRDMGSLVPTITLKKFTKPGIMDITGFSGTNSITIEKVGYGMYLFSFAALTSCKDYDSGILRFSINAEL